jgi:hypothetical protein
MYGNQFHGVHDGEDVGVKFKLALLQGRGDMEKLIII